MFTRRVAFAVLVIGALVLGIEGAAVAHNELGLMTLEVVAGRGQTAELRARVVYADDRHAASSATVTVDAAGPGGAKLTVVPMTAEGDGVYTAFVALPAPGAWTFRATAASPDASAAAALTVSAPAVTITATTSTPRSAGDTDGRRASSVATEASGGTDWLVPVLAGVVVLGAVGAAVVLLRRRP